MSSQWKAGDKVRLKSGGPSMTVQKINEKDAGADTYCIWFAAPDYSTPRWQSFAGETLEADTD